MDFRIEGAAPARAMVIHVELRSRGNSSAAQRTVEARLEEAIGLAKAIDLSIEASIVALLAAPRPATLLGSGKVEEVASIVKTLEVELVIVNAQLSPVQQRNLERAWNSKVLDRTGLILEIFGRRASTREGTLQVELAHLQYQKSRLVRSWTHLERQRGGFGFLGGPGESQLEADRRMIQERIGRIEKQLEQVVKTRTLHRRGRARVPYSVIALVGYTNAGKSTLFNRLSGAGVLAKDLLFATLDPTMRVMTLPHGRRVIISDTVGFISDLPTTLVAAFRATLEEVLSADLILHVRDISHPDTDAQASDVAGVLGELGVDEAKRAAMIEVWNKMDLLPDDDRNALEARSSRSPDCVLVSAVSGEGVSNLLDLIEDRLTSKDSLFRIVIDLEDGRGRAWLHERGEVLACKILEDGRSVLSVRLSAERVSQARERFGRSMRSVEEGELLPE